MVQDQQQADVVEAIFAGERPVTVLFDDGTSILTFVALDAAKKSWCSKDLAVPTAARVAVIKSHDGWVLGRLDVTHYTHLSISMTEQ